uniref:DDH domain-containing protein n=1 Tax=Plectus sambesii TaxID=2011161 RepID=A0A914VHG6_9BILA
MAALVAELTAVKNCLQRALQKGVRESVVLVFGNESCDLDSACCSIVYALFAQQKRENKDEIVAPVLNLKREQFLSRTEVLFWLDRVLLNNSGRSSSAVYDEACARLLDSLIFIDDIDFGQIDTFRQLKVKMMDHNRLIDAQKFLEPYVDEIIDHHEVSGSAHPWSNAVRTEIVHPVGSCASLITRRLRDEWPSMPSSVALLLYGAIVLDTSALLNSNKTTDIDVSAVEYLESKYSGVEGWPGRSYTDAMLIEAKMDVSRMSAFDIFGKDFKSVPGSQ